MENLELLCKEKNYSKEDINSFKHALDFSKKYLFSEKRLNGESVYFYNLKIAKYLIESKMSRSVVVAGFLYGLENKISKENLKEFFDGEVVNLVFEQLKLKEIKEKSKSASADLMRQIFFTTLYDIRVVFVRLASKLVNLETMESFAEKEQKRLAEDAVEFYAPLAGRLGAEKLKQKIIQVSFRVINPRKYREIENFLKETYEERQLYLEKIIKEFENFLKGKSVKIKGRQKQIYSIYKKMKDLKKPLETQRDHLAIRIIVENEKSCYDCLGVLHENYKVIPGTLKDYISCPKENGYQSIHTCLELLDSKILEVQIRTVEMDEVAEEGVAAHWSYKKLKTDIGFEKKTAWLKEIFELQKGGEDKDFLESLKLNLFEDRIYCYTPKGDVFDFPKNSTILDFAYRIHGKVGDLATGGRINGNFSSLKKELTSGDVVEIVTNKFQRPRRAWLKFVVTSRAKSHIKKGVKRYEDVKVVRLFPTVKDRKLDFEDLVISEEFPNHKYNLARCCNPLPLDEIVGVIKSYRKILVHKKNCNRIDHSTKSQIHVNWKETFNRPIKIKLKVNERSGILSDILNTVSRGGFVIKEANIKMIDKDYAECFLVVVPREIKEVEMLIKRIEKIRGILKIWFS
ncbi:bifunctional (p)ppGpp synthetase/guanosine-3',5'-bis(diphosphate) 3'-pyrophosphohydrolase [Candidatus Pacearchaeota archaeon]|nr:bifunctional (p)ppGpp synthetase/guanosine-3',5'-bis(diphosphate) 3'-pyrophosphohydrolase [Candidatus Pacearchaeota archaeon]